MHDNFEREVQKKMEELNLTPSAPVWEKIELEIKPEKKRRRPILWLFFAGLIASGGLLTYNLIGSSKAGTNEVITSENVKNTVPQTNGSISKQKNKAVEIKTSSGNEPHNPNATIDQTTSTNNSKPFVAIKQISEKPKSIIRREQKITSTGYPTGSNQLSTVNQVPNKSSESFEKEEKTIQPNVFVSDDPKAKSQVDKPSLTPDTAVTTQPVSVSDSIASPAVTKPSFFKTDSLLKKKVAAGSKWKKHVNIRVGSSGYGTIELFRGYAMRDVSASPPPITGSGNNGVVRKASSVNRGLAYSVGLSLAKAINQHLEISFGFQYAQYSTTTKVGSMRSNPVTQSNAGTFTSTQFYTNTNTTNDYTNHFHAVELPVTVSYKPVLKWPVRLSVGAAYGQLVATNALIYNSVPDVYYQDKNSYVHQMLPLFTSIEAELLAKNKLSFRIGPTVQYNVLRLKKASTNDASHLVFAGVKTAIIF